MNEIIRVLPAFGVGVLLGFFFFGGLWWTVSKGMTSPRPELWFLGSLLVRTGVTLAGFYWAAHGDWKRVLACLVGFVIARVVVARSARREAKTSEGSEMEPGHAH